MKLIDVSLKKMNVKEIIERALQLFHFNAVRIIVIEPPTRKLFELESYDKEDIDSLFFEYCRKIMPILEKEQQALLIDGEFLYDDEAYGKYNDQNFVEIYVPIFKEQINGNILAGIVFISSKKELDTDISSRFEFNEFLYELRTLLIARYDLARKKESSYQVAYMLCEIIDMREPYLISRLFNVAHWCIKISKVMELPQIDIDKLMLATLMHDLGRIYVEENTLTKRGKLTDKEYELMKKRVNYSYEIAEKLVPLYEIYDLPEIILNCQERVDGKGYPFGKKGDEIPLLSKVLYVAKAVSAMLTNTSYNNAKTIPEVINELKDHSNTQFDEGVVEAAVVVLSSESKYSEDILLGIGSFATFNIKINNDGNDENLNFWGNIKKMDDKYVFTPSVKMYNIHNYIIHSCSIYISHNAQIIHYTPDIAAMSEDEIVFSRLEVDNDNNLFSINWLLKAILVTPSREVYEIYVTLIGGNHIDFYIFEKDIKEDVSEGVIKLTFEDGKKATLPGIVISDDRVNDKILYRLKYIGIEYEDMKTTFSQLFKKQIQLRNIIKRI